MSYDVYICPPRSAFNNKNVTLHLVLDKLYMIGQKTQENYVAMEENIDFDHKLVYKNFSPPAMDLAYDRCKFFTLHRDIPMSYLSTTKMKIMPGFRLRWWYTGDEVQPEPISKLEPMTNSFMTNFFVR